jgi:predicted Zn-dependent peptidase
MVEVRLRVPFFSAKPAHLAQSTLLSDTILTGTENRDRNAIAVALQEIGGGISVGLDADRLMLSASALAQRFPDLLGLFADVLTAASYPEDEVAGERDRLLERIVMARSQAGVIADEALGSRMAPGHPYGVSLPSSDEVTSTSAQDLRTLHSELVRPTKAVVVIVGDVSPEAALDAAEQALSGWTGEPATGDIPPLPALASQPLLIIDRPGSVQTSLRFGGEALSRQDPRYSALQLANLIFGGYFSSRWVENIREDKGYTYSPRSSLEHAMLGSSFAASADVATEVTAPAVLETLYELGRISSLPVTETELESVRQYAIGTLALSTATQAGLASTLSALLGVGLDVEWLAARPAELAKVTIAEVAEVAAEFLAPQKLVGVAVGDSQAITASLAAIIRVESNGAGSSAAGLNSSGSSGA